MFKDGGCNQRLAESQTPYARCDPMLKHLLLDAQDIVSVGEEVKVFVLGTERLSLSSYRQRTLFSRARK